MKNRTLEMAEKHEYACPSNHSITKSLNPPITQSFNDSIPRSLNHSIPQSLNNLINNERRRTVAVVGLAKNTGKTTTLNAVISVAAVGQLLVGLTSAGRDGESIDEVTGLEKPSIWVPAGTLFVTAKETLAHCCAHRIVREIPINTPLGGLVLCMTTSDGEVEVAGASTRADIETSIRLMQEQGAQLTLIDGSAGRTFSCAPSVAQGTILATGAAFSSSMERVVAHTAHFINLLELSPPPPHILRQAEQVIAVRGTSLLSPDGEPTPLDLPTLLNSGGQVAAQMKEQGSNTLITSGAVTDSLVEALLQKVDAPRIISADMTCVFITPTTLRRLKRCDGNVHVVHRSSLIAVTLNPWSPWGQGFSPDRFAAEIERISPVPVYDLKKGPVLQQALTGER